MLSRVAESAFWMTRYIERAENIARFIDVNQHLALDDFAAGQWAPLVAITGDLAEFEARYETASRDSVLQLLTIDAQYGNSILSCVRRARENARTIREVISVDMWEEINQFYHFVERWAKEPTMLLNPHAFLAHVRRASNTIEGITNGTMSHDEAWNFVQLARMLERADKTSRILDVKYFILLPTVHDVGTPIDTIQWSALLKSASALHMYRRRHGRISPEAVAEFLLLDRYFPRSVHFCLLRAEQALREVSGSSREAFTNRAEQLLGRLRSELDYLRVQEVFERGMHEFIDNLQSRLNQIGEAIHQSYFVGAPEPMPFTQSQHQ
ncbi:MAG: alpha-E domain-containing protein [Planctomycetaceae bacterium]|nr:alpha-E domain-containing protein [Planctomycetaceae bacterium]